MEISSTPLECCRLLKLTRRDSESYRKTALVSCIICFACRALLPSVLLLLALRQESPLVMDNVPMIAGVTLGSYFAFYHCLLLYQSVRRVLAPSAQYDTPYSCDSFIPFSIHDYPEVLRNDFRSETPPALSEDIEKNREAGMKDFSHRLMRSYDSSDVSSGELPGNDKFNVQKRKENSKYILLHKAPKEMYQDPLLVSLDHVSPDKHSSRAALLDSMVESGVDERSRSRAGAGKKFGGSASLVYSTTVGTLQNNSELLQVYSTTVCVLQYTSELLQVYSTTVGVLQYNSELLQVYSTTVGVLQYNSELLQVYSTTVGVLQYTSELLQVYSTTVGVLQYTSELLQVYSTTVGVLQYNSL
ncbi:hypothetical protein Btru_068145 [Bulinus truncatus]|nr:hypothetical protein Btru_068145 [Bulinus truncatus]